MTPPADRSPLIRLVHVGLGPIGAAVAELVQERPGMVSVAAVDLDSELVGRSLSGVIGRPKGPDIEVTPDLASGLVAEVAVHCTGSRLHQVEPQLIALVERGLDVVSTCEELSFPWREAPDAARRIDLAAQNVGVTVLGTGVNPGYVMDLLPVVASAPMRSVTHVAVHRVQDAAHRRFPLRAKVGAGLTVARFEEGVAAGTLGHVGLRESVGHVAVALGWTLTDIAETIEPIVADTAIESGRTPIRPGEVAGIHHVVSGRVDDIEVVTLILDMAVGLGEPADEIRLSGEPDIRLVIPGGLHGDTATAAITANAIPTVRRAPPGLKTMTDLPPVRATVTP